jgi:hypothetical protein
LKPGGFLLTLDPLYCDDQSAIARRSSDATAGEMSRREAIATFSIGFRRVEVSIERSPLRIPYTGVVVRRVPKPVRGLGPR